MRRRKRHAGLSVNAVAGTYVVFFGRDLAANKHAGCRGFGFKRYDHDEGDTIWLQGLKTFAQTEPHPAAGERFSTLHHPIQGFQWADYGAKPGTTYTYTIVALYGYTHYAFRESVKIYMEKGRGAPEDWKPQFLVDDDSRLEPYFDPHDRSARDTRRKYFGGAMSVSATPH